MVVIFLKTVKPHISNRGIYKDDNIFLFKTVDVAVIKKQLKNKKIHKATGNDLLPPKLLKLGSHILCYPLCFILNMCFTSGMFPDILKQAELCHLRKETLCMYVTTDQSVYYLLFPKYMKKKWFAN